MPTNSLYPEPKRGSLAPEGRQDNPRPEAKGPKMGNMQSKLFMFGIICIVLLAGAMIAAFVAVFRRQI